MAPRDLQQARNFVPKLERASAPVERRLEMPGEVRSKRWLASGVLPGRGRDEAVVAVTFARGASQSTLQAFEHADRLVVVLAGKGHFWWSNATLPEIANTGSGELASQPLVPGEVLALPRGLSHGLHATKDSGLELLVCHLPYISPEDPRYRTISKHGALASNLDIRAVFRDTDLLAVLCAVQTGLRSSSALCSHLHCSAARLEELSARLEELRMVVRDDLGSWHLHPTVTLREEDEDFVLSREERWYRVEQRARRIR
jgi:quercetin dioxygenase-like cupin family protein